MLAGVLIFTAPHFPAKAQPGTPSLPAQLKYAQTIEARAEAAYGTFELKAPISPCRDQTQPELANIQACIRYWAAQYGQDVEYMVGIARCESTFNPANVNHGYTAGGGNPSGLFQYLPETWARYTSKLGKPHYDIWNYEHQAEVTAFAFSVGGRGEWAC